MKRPATPRILFLLCIGLCLLFAQVGVSAQTDNLLTNPGFEQPFVSVAGGTVAQGWQPWHLPPPAGAASYVNRQPEYSQTSPNTARILSGNDAQTILSFFATHDGGVYQRVTGVPAGSLLRFSVNAYAWSTVFDEVDLSEEDGDLIVRVGIDPAGGTDPTSASVVWSSAVEQYDAYHLYSVDASSSGSAVTVFVRTTIGVPIKHNHIYLDDAALVIVDGGSPLPVFTETPLPTTIPTDVPVEPTVIPVLPTDVPVLPTDVPVEPTAVPVEPTDIPVEPTDIPVQPTDVPVLPTETPLGSLPTEDPVLLTATAIIGEATKIAEANLTATALAQPTDVPVQPTDVPVQPTNVPVQPTAVQPTTVPPTTIPPTAVQPTPAQPPTATPEGVGPFPTALPPTAVPVVPTVPPVVSEEFPAMIVHTVQRGESVITLATRYGSSVDAIAQRNGLGANYLILVGQRLLIPVRVPPPSTVTPVPVVGPNENIPPIGTGNVYVVRSGDTLARIARLFNTTPEALAQLNGIVSEASLQRGQSLRVPGSGDLPATPTPPTGSQQTYTVQRNDTLYWLSIRFGVSIADLARANNIQNTHVIYPGQVLVIP